MAVDVLMARQEYPDIDHVYLGAIIGKCWDGKTDSAVAVAEGIAAYRSAHSMCRSPDESLTPFSVRKAKSRPTPLGPYCLA